MSVLLTQYFEDYAENSITRMKESILAVSFYERIKARLVKKEDLSKELPIIAKVGAAGTMTVVTEAIAHHKSQVSTAWDLSPRLQKLGKQKVILTVNEREHLPRAVVSYQFKSSAGTVNVNITSAGENFKLDINAGKNPMAAQMACIELEKQLTFIALTG